MMRTLDGVRPRHAICHQCGYQFGGLEIKDGEIVCPECGKSSRFELRSRAEELARLRARIQWRRRILGGLMVLGLLMLLFISLR